MTVLGSFFLMESSVQLRLNEGRSSRFEFIAKRRRREKGTEMLLLRPEFVFEGTTEERKRICEGVSSFPFLYEDYPRTYRETIATRKSITINLLSKTYKQVRQFLLGRAIRTCATNSREALYGTCVYIRVQSICRKFKRY